MVIAASAAEGFARGSRVTMGNGGEFVRSTFIGAQEKPATPDPHQPQFYTIDQMPQTVVDPHYHAVEQWQVIVRGDGTLGRHPARPVAVHYVDRYTGYGPITAGADGLMYYTVRAMSDPGAQFLHKPEVRDKLKSAPRSKKRYLYIDADTVRASAMDELKACTGVMADEIIGMHEDGVAAWLFRLGPHAEASAPDPARGGGQGLLVVGGALLHEDKALPELSCLFVGASDRAMRLRAGAEGAELLVLQFPRAELAGVP